MSVYVGLCAIFYVAGVFLYDFCSYDCLILFGLSIVAAGMIFAKSRRAYPVYAVIFLGLGMLACFVSSNPRFNDLYSLNGKYIAATGYVFDIPDKYEDVYSYKIKLFSAEYMGKTYETEELIKVTSKKKLAFGEIVTVKGFLEEFSDRSNSTDFNTKRYYQSRSIFYKMYARELFSSSKTPEHYSIAYYVNLLKSKLADNVDKVFDGDDAAVLKAVFWGNKRQFSNELKNSLLYTGMSKFLYSSYLHIFIISTVVTALFSHVKKGKRDAVFLLTLLCYAIFNASNAVNVKNAVAIIISILMIKKLGFSHYNDIAAISILSVCVLNPLYCFDTGLTVSFAFGFVYRYLGEMLDGVIIFIPFKFLRKTIKLYIVSTLGLLPITAYFFDGINLYTNLLVPIYSVVVTVVIFLTFLMNLFLAIFKSALFLKPLLSPFLWYFTDLPTLVAGLPFSKIWLKAPGFLEICTFYLTLYAIRRIYMKNSSKTVSTALLFACCGFWGAMIFNAAISRGTVDINFVNVGQGDGAVINVRGGETVLIDGGGRAEFENYDAGENIFLPYLTKKGYTKIDKAVVSHYHSDHVPGVIAAAKYLGIKEFIMPDCESENEYRKELEQIAAKNNAAIRYVKKGDIIDCGSGLVLRVLSPDDEDLKSEDLNKTSVVIRADFCDFSCLFTGDIGFSEEMKIAEEASGCDIVKMAHHGSAKSNGKAFTKAVSADYAIATVAEGNVYGFPSKEAVANYQQFGTKVLRTDVNGDITVHINKKGEYEIFKNLKNERGVKTYD